MEEGEKERLQQNGEASNLALGKVDAGEGELMLSPAQTPQVRFRVEGGKIYVKIFVLIRLHTFRGITAHSRRTKSNHNLVTRDRIV